MELDWYIGTWWLLYVSRLSRCITANVKRVQKKNVGGVIVWSQCRHYTHVQSRPLQLNMQCARVTIYFSIRNYSATGASRRLA